MNPNNVNPRNFNVIEIIYTSPDGSFSIAKGEWTDDRMNRFAMRWNGDVNNPADNGYPSVLGHPMWFQLPYDVRDIINILTVNSRMVV